MKIRRLLPAALIPAVLAAALLHPATASARTAAALNPAYGSKTVSTLPQLVVGGHRNGGLEFPENTYAGSNNALAAGVQVLDYDLHTLADHTPVVLHDTDLKRLTTTSGNVSNLTLAEFQRLCLDPANWFGPGYSNEHPMTAAQLLDRFRGRAVLLVELKEADALNTFAAQIKSRNMVDQVIVQSNSPVTVRQIAAAGLHAQLWRNLAQLDSDNALGYKAYDAEWLEIDPRATSTQFAKALSSGLPVWAYGVNNPTQFRRLQQLGVTGMISDAPLYASGATTVSPVRPAATVTTSTTVRRGVTKTIQVKVLAPSVGYPVPGAKVTISIGGQRFYGTTATDGVANIAVRSTATLGRHGLYTNVATTAVATGASMLDKMTVSGSTSIIGSRSIVTVTK